MRKKWKSVTTDGKGNNTKLYLVWKSMKNRCTNINYKDFPNYGGRGITIVVEWLDFDNFYNWCINNGYKEGLQIDRIDNNLGYNPNNCRFVTSSENQLNKNSFGEVKFKGVTKRPSNRFAATYNREGKAVYIGTYNTPEEASAAYQDYIAKL